MNPKNDSPTPSRNGSNDEKDNDSSTSASSVHDVASTGDAETVLSSMASRVFLDVLSARVLGTQLDGNSLTAVDELDSQGDNEMGGNDDVLSLISSSTEATTASLAPSLSISSIARAEQILHKSVPLVNGGRHVALTKEDVKRIRDGELLRFLETNSAMFVKYLQRQGESAPVTETIDTNVTDNADVEQEIQNLANRIETFITAFDDEGQQYQICVDNEGKLLVPVAPEDVLDDTAESDAAEIYDHDDKVMMEEYDVEEEEEKKKKEGQKEETIVDEHPVESSVKPPNAVMMEKGKEKEQEEESEKPKKEEKGAVEVSMVSHTKRTMERDTPLGRRRLGRPTHVSPSPTAMAKAVLLSSPPLSSLSQQPQEDGKQGKKQKKKTGKTSKNTMAGRKAPLSTAKAPLVPVRGVGLTAEQDRRVEELMQTDFSTQPSPYMGLADRLAEVEERIRWFQEIRGPLGNDDDDNDNDDIYGYGGEEVNEENNYKGEDGKKEIAEDATVASNEIHHSNAREQQQQQQQQPTAKELGDAYMREVRERRLREARMRSINTRLAQLHYVQQLESLRPAEGAEKIARVPRPSWSHDVPPPPRASEIDALVEEARRENALAVARGEKMPPSVGDGTISYLQEKLRAARERIESLVGPANDGSSSSPSSTLHVS
ncbi:kinectin [Trypanosoma theileri]|uniref:Kinectin n=1 Tax=Trypanosoma theileri TaxID=67003 RepID=A0A1X0NTW4_9TRYP|nr:kinectin [Trypanosoma theileri]ORC88051.1 kinectin [Trypanosoma theileri]